ncbi:mannosyltransferase [Dichomitus squalens]|uniref:GPI mannosyltransferase 2 n=1 Tax=Dichomitus squalens TaxID=114155 RepID=A0A4V2K794_9APHY|nr:mannosyltransferase [Dichomitus squalens]
MECALGTEKAWTIGQDVRSIKGKSKVAPELVALNIPPSRASVALRATSNSSKTQKNLLAQSAMSFSGKQTAHARPANPANHRRMLFAASCAASLLTLILTVAAAQLPLFDSSPKILLSPGTGPATFSLRRTLASAVLRWDAFHFAHIAKEGYVYEHEWAFFPGVPSLMRALGALLRVPTASVGSPQQLSWEDVLVGGVLGSMLSVHSVLTLYDLTLELLGSPSVALLASMLSLLPSSPATLRVAGYTEAFFAWCSYLGMLYCARQQWLFAAFSFMVAATSRSNGISLAGFILWGLVAEPSFRHRRVNLGSTLYAVVLSAMVVSPFVYLQYSAYRVFCMGDWKPAPWCDSLLPSIYSYAQSKYWNVGFLRYWTPEQLPNFLLGAPPLALLLAYTLHYSHAALIPRLRALSTPSPVSGNSNKPQSEARATASPFVHPALAPHAIHALLMCLLLLFASHTQIVLRFAATMPCTYWAAAWLLVERPALGRWWVGWSVVWGAVSCVLWGAFLPPA